MQYKNNTLVNDESFFEFQVNEQNQDQQDKNFVQINGQRLSIQEFLDIIEAKSQDYEDPEELTEEDQVKEDTIQQVLNNFDFGTCVIAINKLTDDDTTDLDEQLDIAYDLCSQAWDIWMEEQEEIGGATAQLQQGNYVCSISPCGMMQLAFVLTSACSFMEE